MQIRYAALAAVALAGIAGSAQGTQITQTLNFGPSTPNFNQTLFFNQYNGLVTDLNFIKVSITLNISGGQLALDNDGAGTASGTAQLGAQATTSSSSVKLLDLAFLPVTGTASAVNATGFNLDPDDGDGPNYQPGGPDNFVFNGSPASDMKMGLINSLFWGGYVGAGTFDIKVDAVQVFDYGALGGISFAGSPVSAGGSVTVVYDIIPTPGAGALLGLGGLAVFRRRR